MAATRNDSEKPIRVYPRLSAAPHYTSRAQRTVKHLVQGKR